MVGAVLNVCGVNPAADASISLLLMDPIGIGLADSRGGRRSAIVQLDRIETLLRSSGGDYAANIEMAEGGLAAIAGDQAPRTAQRVATPHAHTIEEVADLLQIPATRLLKTLIVHGAPVDGNSRPLVALVLRGDQELNAIKAGKLPLLASPLTFADEAEIVAAVGCKPGSIGPVGLNMPVIADNSVQHLVNFTCGANVDGYHLQDANWGQECRFDSIVDLRKVREGDAPTLYVHAPDTKLSRGIDAQLAVANVERGRFDLHAVLKLLTDREINEVHVETGATLAGPHTRSASGASRCRWPRTRCA